MGGHSIRSVKEYRPTDSAMLDGWEALLLFMYCITTYEDGWETKVIVSE